MPDGLAPFPPETEARFHASRVAALAQVNLSTYRSVALLVISFSVWDRFVDPANWTKALVFRAGGVAVILAVGVVQRVSGRIDWAPALARIRYAAAVAAVSGALAVLEQGYSVGLAGLITTLLAGPYIALDHRELWVLNIVPMITIGLIMFVAGTDRFVVINSWVFIALAVYYSGMQSRVFEATNRRTFMLEQELIREARTDVLTGLHNRRALDERAGIELKRCVRDGTPLAIVVCDLDHFKPINDQYGHDVGDQVIRTVASRLRTLMRDTDVLGRWGGEEFLAILPSTGQPQATLLAERLRATVETIEIPGDSGVRVTVSVGVANVAVGTAAQGGEWERAVKAADDALYRAKAAGRNRVVVAPTVI